MSGEKNKVAALQMASSPNVSANLLEAERLISEAAESGAGLVVLPENFAFKGEHDRDMLTLCEDDDGPLQGFLGQMAQRYGVWLVGGTIPMRAKQGGKVRAACLIMDNEGNQVARYDKIHLFDVHLVETDERYVESNTIEPGEELVTVETPFGVLGIAVCYDLRFPELFRKLMEKGAEIFAVPASFTAMTGKAHWETLVRARAIENLAFVVAAAQGGYHLNGRETHGHSMIVDPWGTVLTQVPRGTGFVNVEIDREYQQTIRRTFPTIDHLRL
ncbi:MAG: carbon-nitrogen hydrolase family protein [Candidatus Thiodiazotropha sp. (ex Ctena orbiculata)]|uniref:Carbon-nitrogen hydrolase family protein n=1 Tax=Candidatus Thiodiazotropha taylori TaxID=2792791 RepID=A0A944M8A0_9GAMM|nr:carbon-nitrogen hydrolase family protein [Candidatus Thiodiazotropha taylori]PUB85942.1 MAG: acyltransferase [gamma proteobacterium symbiont of Ctena orbiculata]MBT2989114.1 carbon-nitrogen hydrolase family protein [Candidatus Thiodiazotropha taylori]MBT2995675.1 carbon-nitrogen hydrolase family protein [Candidatus Thiodiazotropha taylori]MBT2999371.1 carbon-nitrogen hydrolase family protein [Candidatus Thiodiazotropha taylori]